MRKNCRRDSVRGSVPVYHGVVYDEHLGRSYSPFAQHATARFPETEAGAQHVLERFTVLDGRNRVSFTVSKGAIPLL